MNLLQTYGNFDNFGNEGWIPNQPGYYDSLESLHDQIHGLVGNGGHMSIVCSLVQHIPCLLRSRAKRIISTG